MTNQMPALTIAPNHADLLNARVIVGGWEYRIVDTTIDSGGNVAVALVGIAVAAPDLGDWYNLTKRTGLPRASAADVPGQLVALGVNGFGEAVEVGVCLCREGAGAPYSVYPDAYPDAFGLRYTIVASRNPRYINGQAFIAFARGPNGEFKKVSLF